MNLYLLSFDPHKTDAKGLHQVIDKNPHVKDWWHFLGSTYLLASNESLYTVKQYIKQNWPQQRYIIIKVDASDYNGWLPQKAWDWIKKYK